MKKPIALALTFSCLVLFLMNACNSGKLIGVDDEPEYDKTRILVLLKEKASPDKLVINLSNYGLEKIGPASRTFNEWLFKWSAKVAPEVVLEKIRESPLVEKAEFPELYQENN